MHSDLETMPNTTTRLEDDKSPRGLQPVDQPESLKQIAYKALHQALLTGDLKPGEIYKEKDLAQMLNISRTPVREALLELSAKGLVTFLPRKGVQVTQFDLQDLNEIFELRKALELMAIEKVAATITKNQLHDIQAVLDGQRSCAQANDFMGFLSYDREFHTLFSELTNNRRLVANLETIRDLIQFMGAHALSAQGRLQEVITEHQAVLDALFSRDPEEARNTMDFHLEMSRKKAEIMLFPHQASGSLS
ncbi:MAG: GntR family transcriptional regulator [Desulfovermiculus sp.]|nr:GntR family transcriptional regulator [Desulfovermiculus sp.]